MLAQHQRRVLTTGAAHLGQALGGRLEAIAEELNAVAIGIMEIERLVMW